SSASPSKDARSASQRGTVLHAERSPDHHRTLEDSLQHGPSAQQSRGPATRSRNYPACELRTNMVGGTKTPGWSVIETPRPPAPARTADRPLRGIDIRRRRTTARIVARGRHVEGLPGSGIGPNIRKAAADRGPEKVGVARGSAHEGERPAALPTVVREHPSPGERRIVGDRDIVRNYGIIWGEGSAVCRASACDEAHVRVVPGGVKPHRGVLPAVRVEACGAIAEGDVVLTELRLIRRCPPALVPHAVAGADPVARGDVPLHDGSLRFPGINSVIAVVLDPVVQYLVVCSRRERNPVGVAPP